MHGEVILRLRGNTPCKKVRAHRARCDEYSGSYVGLSSFAQVPSPYSLSCYGVTTSVRRRFLLPPDRSPLAAPFTTGPTRTVSTRLRRLRIQNVNYSYGSGIPPSGALPTRLPTICRSN